MLRQMSHWTYRVSSLALILVLSAAEAGATPPGQFEAAMGGVLIAQEDEEPGGFRFEAPPGPKKVEPSAGPAPEVLAPQADAHLAKPRDPVPGYVALGLSAAFAIAGTVFAVNTAAAISDFPSLDNGEVFNADFETRLEDAQSAMLVNGLATSVLFSACISSLIAGTLYLVAD